MSSFTTNFYLIKVQNEWKCWLNRSIFTFELDAEDIKINISKHLRIIIETLIKNFQKKGFVFKKTEMEIINIAMNYYFHVWRTSKEYNGSSYPLTVFGKKQFELGLLPHYEMSEYLEKFFPFSFWEYYEKKFGTDYGIFDREYSDFGRVFWDNIPMFIYQFLDTKVISDFMGPYERYEIDHKDNSNDLSKVSNEDPYLLDIQSDYFGKGW